MTKLEAQEMLAILSAEFRVRKPKLSFRKMRGGFYHTKLETISMGPTGDSEWVACHEFAHHLDHVLNKPRRTKKMSSFGDRMVVTGQRYHDVPFRFCLLRVAAAWYGDSALYPWDKEYATVKKWWAERKAGE